MNSLHKKLCRLTVVVPFLFLTVFSARGQVKVSGNNLKLSEVIEQIQEATDYTFFYNVSDIEGVKAASSNVSGTLEEVLNAVFKGTGISYKIQDKRIALKKEKSAEPQTEVSIRTVKGVVVDAGDKTPLIGATVQIKGSNDVSITDIDG